MRNLEGIFRGSFLTHRTKAQKFRGKFRSIFRKKIRGSKKIFHAKFNLQTCHLKKCVGDSCCITFGGFCRKCFLPGGFFGALFPTKMRRNNPARKSTKKNEKIREKKHPAAQKKKSAKNPFCQKPTLNLYEDHCRVILLLFLHTYMRMSLKRSKCFR